MPRSPLVGRRIHLSGCIASDPTCATVEDVRHAREAIGVLVERLVRRGANFVVPVDREPHRGDGQPICFDWLVWQALWANVACRPPDASGTLAVAVLHHKTEDQVPSEMRGLWSALRNSHHVQIESAAQWNMNSKRMEEQARWGDILIVLGGDEGVRFLAETYHQNGRPVVPLPLPICEPHKGALSLYAHAEQPSRTASYFRTVKARPQTWVNRLKLPKGASVHERADQIVALLEDLEPPQAFAVRLLNPKHDKFADVDAFFEAVVKPVVEGELGYQLAVVDGVQAYREPRIDGEIFKRLHHSALVIADYTGERPNCFIEMGYALGRGVPTVLTAQEGTSRPFDVDTIAAHLWESAGSLADRRRLFREHLVAVRDRPALVSPEALLS